MSSWMRLVYQAGLLRQYIYFPSHFLVSHGGPCCKDDTPNQREAIYIYLLLKWASRFEFIEKLLCLRSTRAGKVFFFCASYLGAPAVLNTEVDKTKYSSRNSIDSFLGWKRLGRLKGKCQRFTCGLHYLGLWPKGYNLQSYDNMPLFEDDSSIIFIYSWWT